ncbi:MAG: activator of HSP90 ATPase [Maricaulis sp.]|jgi:uncharacterized protein YndB with AHSA1/START domain|nr:activator of HSP90 ATPase [Maricaulis sp.]
MTEDRSITVTTRVEAIPQEAWTAFTSPGAITQWNFASPDWHCPSADVDLRVGGRHTARMEARDGSMGFDLTGTYDEVDPPHAVTLVLDDGRRARTTFEPDGEGTRVTTVFDPENTHSREMQHDGWQAILDSYAAYVSRQQETLS